MKRKTMITLTGIMLMLGVSMTALAMPKVHGGPCNLHRMADDLGLTKEQRQQFKQIHRKSRSEMMELSDAKQDNFEALHQLNPASPEFEKETAKLAHALGGIIEQKVIQHNRMRARIYALLTPEQRKKESELRKQHVAGCGRHGIRHSQLPIKR